MSTKYIGTRAIRKIGGSGFIALPAKLIGREYRRYVTEDGEIRLIPTGLEVSKINEDGYPDYQKEHETGEENENEG